MRRQNRRTKIIESWILAITIVLSSLLFSGCSRRLDAKTIRKRYAAVSANLSPYCDGFFLKDTPQAATLLDQKWSLESAWVIEYLNEHPSATVKQIETEISTLDNKLSGSVTLLDKNLYSISIQEGEIGNVFLAAGEAKRFRIVWNAKDAMAGAGEKGNYFRPWSAQAARDGCRENVSGGDWLSCGPLYGGFDRLPNDKMGRRRFYLDGTYAEYAGLSAAAQLSIWTWDGTVLRPQFTGTYTFYIDQPVGIRIDGEFLRIRVRDQYRTFHTCCDDEGRPMDWNLRLTPTGVEDLGKTPVVSELETIDELFYRIARVMAADDIASPEAQSQARALIRQQPKESGLPAFGSLMTTTSKPVGSVTKFCFEADYSMLFTIKRVEGKPYVVSLKQIDYCPAEPAHK
jgi:hypothetical protein